MFEPRCSAENDHADGKSNTDRNTKDAKKLSRPLQPYIIRNSCQSKAPMMNPQVGVKRLTRPFAATLHIMDVSTDQFIPATIGETIGEESAARPEEEETRKLRPIWTDLMGLSEKWY